MRWKLLILAVAILLVVLPGFVNGVQYGTVTCSYYYFPLSRYICSDGMQFGAEYQMIAYYVPPMEQTTPTYTFVEGAPTGTFSGQ